MYINYYKNVMSEWGKYPEQNPSTYYVVKRI